jgi:probable rRNA maturation factor
MVHLQFEVQDAALHQLLRPARVRRWFMAALAPQVKDYEITLRIVNEDEARELNLRYRGKNYATNVLTFDYSLEPVLMADLVLCAPVIAQEAQQQGKTLQAHWAHLIVHGVLHAQGYDHETSPQDALEMEAVEILLLGSLGYANPYE